jgi:hypothetical protein
MAEMRSEARQAVRVIRKGVADGMGAMQVVPVAGSRRVEMQENARHSQAPDADTVESRQALQRQFEAKLRPLTPRQETAINLLTMGKTVVATARSIKVDPATVHRWKAHNPLFVAELNRRQAALFDSMTVKLRLTMGKAVDELMSLMNSPNPSKRIDTMWKLLPMIKPQKLMIPNAPTEPAEVVDEEIRAERIERGEEADAEITNQERLEHVDDDDRADDLSEDGSALRPAGTESTVAGTVEDAAEASRSDALQEDGQQIIPPRERGGMDSQRNELSA